jgi:hypothetical protein
MKNITKRTRQQILATAYHEAGHVVVGYQFGILIGRKGVSVVPAPSGESLGNASMPLTFRKCPEFDDSDKMRLRLELHAMCLFAGIEAQRNFNPRSVRSYHAHKDNHDAVTLLSYVFFDPDVLSAYIKFLRLRTRQMMKTKLVWGKIVAVAEALNQRKHLSRAEVEDIMRPHRTNR